MRQRRVNTFTEEAEKYIENELLLPAKARGFNYSEITSKNIHDYLYMHNDLWKKSQGRKMKIVCDAMYNLIKNKKYAYEKLEPSPPSGFGNTLTIRYYLK